MLLSEAQVEELVLAQLSDVGWSTVYGPSIAPGEHLAERAEYREVVLLGRLRDAIQSLNPDLPSDAVEDAVKAVLRPESQLALTENWRGYQLLTQGVPVAYRDAEGAIRHTRVRLVDWDHPESNDLLAVNQFTIVGKSERRPDVILFVNGLPLVVIELKNPSKAKAGLRKAFNQLQTYRSHIPDLFTWNQITVISDGMSARAGTFTAAWEHYAPWRTIDGVDTAPDGQPQYEVLVDGMLNPRVLLDLIRNFVVFADEKSGVVKKVAKYHQYWAVTKAVQSTIAAVGADGRAGVVWHTQGSGKSLEMLCYAGKTMREPAMSNPTIVVLTDRNDLDDQLFDDTFANTRPGAPLPEAPVQATSREHLKELLAGRQSGGIVFSTIQKFGLSKPERDAGTSFPLLSERSNIVVMVDEAHRSNYDFIDGFARHLRDGLPNAAYIGFTGTPIDETDKSTRQVFGEYIDIYDLTQAVEDNATVPVLYEARLAKVELPASAFAELDDEFAEATSGTEDEARERLKTRWARIEAIVGSDKRIAELAEDIVTHWEARREILAGKAMVVTMSRRIAANLYNEIARLRPDWVTDDDTTGRVKVVITGSADDDPLLQPHIRSKEARRDLKNRAKDPSDELELVIVRDMWLTGFDSPSMHTMYVDKPMNGAPLMQAIARVNRTFKDKPSGLVVDYLGIADDLRSALASYTKRDQQGQQLGQNVAEKIIPAMVSEHEVVCTILHSVPWRDGLASGDPKAFLHTLGDTVEYLIAQHPGTVDKPCTPETPCVKCRFMGHSRRLIRLYAMCAPCDESQKIRDDVAFFEAVRAQISKIEGPDQRDGDPNSAVETAMKQIISGAIAGAGVIDIYHEAGIAKPDISLINDDFLKKFQQSSRPALQMETLKRMLNAEIKHISKRNIVTGKQFSNMLADTLLRYQNRTLSTAQVIAELVDLAKQLQHEQHRGADLGLSEDELAFYDAIRTNDAAVLELGDDQLKKIAHELLEVVRRDAKTDWNVKEQVRARLRFTIKMLLKRYKYPPDQQEAATQLVLEQAEVLAAEPFDDDLDEDAREELAGAPA